MSATSRGALAAFVALTFGCSSSPYARSFWPDFKNDTSPKEVRSARWAHAERSALGPTLEGVRYFILEGKLVWLDANGGLNVAPDSLPDDLESVYAVPTSKSPVLVAIERGAGSIDQTTEPTPQRLLRIAPDRASAAVILTGNVSVVGPVFGALAIRSARGRGFRGDDYEPMLLVDIETGATRDWPGLAPPSLLVFRDAKHGLGRFPGGGLEVTSDGGATFQQVNGSFPWPSEWADIDWRSDKIVLRNKKAGSDSDEPSGWAISEDDGARTPLREPVSPLERWLLAGQTDILKSASRGVLLKDGTALVAARLGKSGEPEHTSFARVNLDNGFVEAVVDSARTRCWVSSRDHDTLFLGCEWGDSPLWVEPVERDWAAITKALATFADPGRAIRLPRTDVDEPFQSVAEGVTLVRGSCELPDAPKREWASCLIEGDSKRDIDARHEGLIVAKPGGGLVSFSLSSDGLVMRELQSTGHFAGAMPPIPLGPAVEHLPAHGLSAFAPSYDGRYVVVAHFAAQKHNFLIEIDTKARTSSVKDLDQKDSNNLAMFGQQGLQIVHGNVLMTTEAGRSWSAITDTPQNLIDSDSETMEFRATDVGTFWKTGTMLLGWGKPDAAKPPVTLPANGLEVPETPFIEPRVWTVQCARSGPPRSGARALHAELVGGNIQWTIDWTDGTGAARHWKGPGPSLDAQMIGFRTLGDHAAFRVRVSAAQDQSATDVIVNATGDHARVSAPFVAIDRGEVPRIAPDGALVWLDPTMRVWAADAPAESIRAPWIAHDVTLAGAGADSVVLAIGGFQSDTDVPMPAFLLPLSDASTAMKTARIPVTGWFRADAFANGPVPPKCGPKELGRLALTRDVLWFDRSPHAFAEGDPRFAIVQLGYDESKPLDPSRVCLVGIELPEPSGIETLVDAVNGRGYIDFPEGPQPLRCSVADAAPAKSAP